MKGKSRYPTRPLLETEKAYLAGIVDGEGYLGIQNVTAGPDHNQRFRPQVGIYNIAAALGIFLSEIGFCVTLKTKVRANEQPIFVCQLSERAARPLLTDILPYMKIKKMEATLLLRFIEIREEKRKTRPFRKADGTFPAREPYGEEEMELIRKLFELKTNKGPAVNKALYEG